MTESDATNSSENGSTPVAPVDVSEIAQQLSDAIGTLREERLVVDAAAQRRKDLEASLAGATSEWKKAQKTYDAAASRLVNDGTVTWPMLEKWGLARLGGGPGRGRGRASKGAASGHGTTVDL